MCYDVAIIGAGVIGALTAREFSRYNLKTTLLEAANDVAMGATKANSAIVHAGFDALPGTLKAKFNVLGCEMMPEVCKDLSVPYKNNGSLVVAFSEEEKELADIPANLIRISAGLEDVNDLIADLEHGFREAGLI